MADKITLDLKYAQDLVDFWSAKYEAIKAELSAAEARSLFVHHCIPFDASSYAGEG
jgi:hypothetical protein